MKKILITAVLAIPAIIWSCQDNPFDENDAIGIDQPLTVETAKTHFKELMSSNPEEEYSGELQKLEVLWSKAYSDIKDNMEYVEVPVYRDRLRVTLYTFPQDSVKLEPDLSVTRFAVQKLMFYKDSDRQIKEKFITYIPDREYLIRRKGEVALNSVKKMQSNFKGYIEYSDWDGNVTEVIRIENGKEVHRYTNASPEEGNSLASAGRITSECCVDVYVEGVLVSSHCSPCGGGGGGGGTCYDECNPSCVNYTGDPCTCSGDCGDDGDTGGGGGGGSASAWDIDQTFGRLCDNINFQHSANSFTAEIQGLGGTYFNYILNKSINIELGTNCVDIPEYYISTSHDAAVGFSIIFNDARTQIEHELESGLLAPNVTAMKNRLITIITSELQTQYPGATFGLGACQGDIPQTTADYGC